MPNKSNPIVHYPMQILSRDKRVFFFDMITTPLSIVQEQIKSNSLFDNGRLCQVVVWKKVGKPLTVPKKDEREQKW